VSYIQVDLKVIEVQGPAMARALGIDENTVLAGLVRLWHRCWSLKTDLITSIEVRGFLAHPDACATMEAFGFLAPTSDMKWRVKGADTYLRVRESRSKAGAARAAGAGRSAGRFSSTAPAQHQHSTSTAPPLTPNTEHRTPNTVKKGSDAPRPGHQETIKQLTTRFEAVRRFKYPFTPRDAKAIKTMLEAHSPIDIAAAWSRALAHVGFPTVSTIVELEKNLAHFVGTGPPVNTSTPEPPSDFAAESITTVREDF
jgi:hypothetical protein